MAGYLAGDVDEWIYIDIDDQHPDSMRFIRDCEAAVRKEIRILRSKEYRCVEDTEWRYTSKPETAFRFRFLKACSVR